MEILLKVLSHFAPAVVATKMKDVRLVRCKKLLNWLKRNGSTVKFFSDKKIFTIDRSLNKRNDRYIASSSSAVQLAMTKKHPASVMTICVVSSEGDVFTLFFAPQEKVNAEVYSRVLVDKILPWMNDKATGKNYVFQQDSAPAHTAKRTIKLLERSM